MRSKEQNIAVQPKIALDDLLTRCTDYDDMSLSMDARELKALKQHISLLESSASTELRSLREQLAELKALEPVAWILNHRDGSGHIEKDKRVADMFEIFASNKTIPLFTAAKPAED